MNRRGFFRTIFFAPPVSLAGERIICAPNHFLLEIHGSRSIDYRYSYWLKIYFQACGLKLKKKLPGAFFDF